MSLTALILGLLLLAVILWDTFETIILPRRVTRKFRITRGFYRLTWRPWAAAAGRIRAGNRQEAFLSVYGPLSMLLLFSTWAIGMVIAFALLHLGIRSSIGPQLDHFSFLNDLYFSGTTFFTLGLGDVTPTTWPARLITVLEGGIGFGFLAMLITYLPVLYEGYSRREINISILDTRAGSPPAAGELLQRHFAAPGLDELREYLHQWESSAGDLMESHLSFPVLCYYRSQHSNQSWLAALATVLDSCAVLIAYSDQSVGWQARLTFGIARHAVVDLSQVLHTPPIEPDSDRLLPGDSEYLQGLLSRAGIQIRDVCQCDQEFSNLRRMYDPYLLALSKKLMMPLPRWKPLESHPDNWQTSAWGRRIAGSPVSEEH